MLQDPLMEKSVVQNIIGKMYTHLLYNQTVCFIYGSIQLTFKDYFIEKAMLFLLNVIVNIMVVIFCGNNTTLTRG